MKNKSETTYCDITELINTLASKGRDESNIGYRLYQYKDLPNRCEPPEKNNLSLVLKNSNKENEPGLEGLLDGYMGFKKGKYLKYALSNKKFLIFIILDGHHLFIYVLKKKRALWSEISSENFDPVQFKEIKRKIRHEMSKAYHAIKNTNNSEHE